MSETIDPLDVLTMMFDAPCLLPGQKRVMWTVPCMVEPALAQKRFGAGDLLIALSPIMHRPAYYLVWIDRRWYPEAGYCTDDLYEALDSEVWPALEEEFGRRDRDDDGTYDWPEVDDEGGCCWRYADPDDILPLSLRQQWIPSFDARREQNPISGRGDSNVSFKHHQVPAVELPVVSPLLRRSLGETLDRHVRLRHLA